jgi:hypothetical protein
MTVSRVESIEAGAGLAAAGALASAFGFAGYRAVFALLAVPGTVAVSAASALIGFMVGRQFLRLLEGEPKPFPQPAFNILDIEPIETEALEVLELTEADRFVPAVVEEPLILDDVLAGVSPDSRVVRLFDRAAMPTPGQLQARIDRHLNGGTSQSPSPDASEALFEALADLRRSLR